MFTFLILSIALVVITAKTPDEWRKIFDKIDE